ncbi:MAG: plasmid replication initiator TrfA [Rubrobacteraceae bacterium]
MESRTTKSPGESRHIVKAEGNFEDLPYFTVGNTRRGDGVIEFRNEIRSGDGQVLKQTWTVRASSGLGLPGTLDQDVYVALLRLIDRQGVIPEDRWISFSLYEMVQLLNRTHGGRDYQQLKRSLDRMAGTRIQSKNAFYHKNSKTFMDGTFGLLDQVQHSETLDNAGRSTEKTRVQLSEYFVSSYRSDYLKGLDVDFYYSLNSAVAKRLYRFIDKKRNRQRTWQVDLFSLRDRIPLSNYKYPSKIREKLAPAHEELTEKGFLEDVSHNVSPERIPLVCYKIQESFSSRRPAIYFDRTPSNLIAVERLKAEGMRSDTAEELVSLYGHEHCIYYSEALPHQKNVRKPAGWLYWAITEGPEMDLPLKVTKALPEPTPEAPQLTGEESGGEGNGAEDTPPALPPEPDPAALALWEDLLYEFSEESGSDNASIWFSSVVPTSLESDVLTLVAPNDFACDYIADRFLDHLHQTARLKLDRELELILQPLIANT